MTTMMEVEKRIANKMKEIKIIIENHAGEQAESTFENFADAIGFLTEKGAVAVEAEANNANVEAEAEKPAPEVEAEKPAADVEAEKPAAPAAGSEASGDQTTDAEKTGAENDQTAA